MNIDARIGKEVFEHRIRFGVPQLVVCNCLGISQPALSRLENGHRRLLASEVLLLKDLMGFNLYKVEEDK